MTVYFGDRIIDAIDTLSGYESNIEEVAKN